MLALHIIVSWIWAVCHHQLPLLFGFLCLWFISRVYISCTCYENKKIEVFPLPPSLSCYLQGGVPFDVLSPLSSLVTIILALVATSLLHLEADWVGLWPSLPTPSPTSPI